MSACLQFVAHPSCQKKLTTLWYGDFYKLLKRRSTLVQTGVVMLITLLYPILAVTYMLAPDTTVSTGSEIYGSNFRGTSKSHDRVEDCSSVFSIVCGLL